MLTEFVAAISKGFIDWLQQANPDVVCLQEIKVSEQLPLLDFEEDTLIIIGFQLQKKGYSGVAILSKK
jgi:exodeoxyribonuclease-3